DYYCQSADSSDNHWVF
nr:immunoglobulin light chain junction region [Macaca mulatta]MOW68381.1 immunoglobulin light chain junction region [Macaca mulatta]MOW69251.1 immunoglobulin light chain junction region [Macaca mulatta]MOW70029.1 immunoglobulin light chain junction region [Macaca mulatta]MOW71080.1 immunoglobulin light chain junction region [Macaca mulatta]